MNLSDTGPLVQARELLLEALANYDAGLEPVPCLTRSDSELREVFDARVVARKALLDVCVIHDLEPGADPRDLFEPSDEMGVDDFVAAHEYAVELISEWLDTGQRPTARPL